MIKAITDGGMAGVRHDVSFTSDAEGCAAWLYPAVTAGSLAPVVVMAHGLSGTRRDRLGPFAERFAANGLAALVFDYRGFGDSAGEPDLFDPARQLADWRAAIGFARTIPGADPSRVVTFGSSMGGGNALAAAAADGQVAAVISQVPFLDLLTQPYRPAPAVTARMLAAAAAGRHLPAVGQPSEPAFINAPGAEEGWRRVVAAGEDSQWRNRVSARWLTGRPYQPARHASHLHCPWLVCVAADDLVAAPGPAIAAARRAPRGVVRTYAGAGHFDIYDGPAFEAVIADQLDFLSHHMAPTAARA